MYVFGGFDGQDRLNDLWRISLTDLHPAWEMIDQVCLPVVNSIIFFR